MAISEVQFVVPVMTYLGPPQLPRALVNRNPEIENLRFRLICSCKKAAPTRHECSSPAALLDSSLCSARHRE